MFGRFVGIDWSGAKGRWQKGLQVAVASSGTSCPRLERGPGPKDKWSRTDVVTWISHEIESQRTLIGLDFAFGFPSIEGLGSVLDWAYVDKLCAMCDNFYGGRFFRVSGAAHSEFVNSPWLPKQRYSAHYLRETDRAAKRLKGATPQSVFNAIGAAQVGPSSTSGMRVLLHLRKNCKDKVVVWPFDPLQPVRSVIVEVFPRYFPLSKNLSPKMAHHDSLNAALGAFGSDPVDDPPQSEDEGDALICAAALRALSSNETSFRIPHQIASREGWIFGVPFAEATA